VECFPQMRNGACFVSALFADWIIPPPFLVPLSRESANHGDDRREMHDVHTKVLKRACNSEQWWHMASTSTTGSSLFGRDSTVTLAARCMKEYSWKFYPARGGSRLIADDLFESNRTNLFLIEYLGRPQWCKRFSFAFLKCGCALLSSF